MVATLKKWQEMLTHVKEMVGDTWKRGWGFEGHCGNNGNCLGKQSRMLKK